mmetsp:Transcript_39388/g.68243  ORF Transcript_39388/g.68243 Transcript_39388/m.68243 type:complete len:296 (+) Transcript_39388:149-1036(+)
MSPSAASIPSSASSSDLASRLRRSWARSSEYRGGRRAHTRDRYLSRTERAASCTGSTPRRCLTRRRICSKEGGSMTFHRGLPCISLFSLFEVVLVTSAVEAAAVDSAAAAVGAVPSGSLASSRRLPVFHRILGRVSRLEKGSASALDWTPFAAASKFSARSLFPAAMSRCTLLSFMRRFTAILRLAALSNFSFSSANRRCTASMVFCTTSRASKSLFSRASACLFCKLSSAVLYSVTLLLSRPMDFLTMSLISWSVYTCCTVCDRNNLRIARTWFLVRSLSDSLPSTLAFSAQSK